ncbi:MAG TPA: PQQ-dependent sugar dehydrogenase, partial [Methylomirabilota bacterium]|nr:PQQ-dependent sugar dehydrogenase [Methylomirabilota bacterium]
MVPRRSLPLIVLLACADASTPPPPPPPGAGVALARVPGAFSGPLYVTAPPADTARLFVVEKTGAIRIVRRDTLLARPFLDLTDSVSGGGEQGLLGLAFHPDYGVNRRFFVHYTDRAGDTRLVRYQVSSDPDSADYGSGVHLLFVDQPFANHNGGWIGFGPDGYLYMGLGDGGSGGDPQGNGQNLGTLLGKILRLDVDGGTPYGIPPDNPFVDSAGARGEVWAYGLRNPWRASFDRLTGDLFIGDVGQGGWEEISVQPAASAGGENYGWNVMEGTHCYAAPTCDATGLVAPVTEYATRDGCAVTGGYVYRGTAVPAIAG